LCPAARASDKPPYCSGVAAAPALTAPHQIDAEHVRFGYLFQCITVRREA